MGVNIRNLMQSSIASGRRVGMNDLIIAARLDNPNPYTRLHIGDMLVFNYNAKNKDKLPYWDAYPLIFVVDVFAGGFYGLNLHYLPIDLRKTLFNKLELLANNFPMLDANSKLRLTYRLLSSTKKYVEFHPCFKHYLTSHVRSLFLKIEAPEWNIAIQLPHVRFQKSTATTVHTDSRRKIFDKKYGTR